MSQSTDPTLILGGGFTGLFTALHLSHQRYSRPVVLIDQRERFAFKPLLYEFLSGEMSDDQVWPRYRELLQGSPVKFIQDTVQAIDLHQRQVQLASGLSYSYRYLVLALGCVNGYFGIEGAQEHSLPFRNGQDAEVLERQLRECLQRASQMEASPERDRLLTVGIIGAGSSGVELAATLADLLPNWYANLGGDPQAVRVVVVEQKPEILATGGDKGDLRKTAQAALKTRTVPVELFLGAKVSAIRPHQIEFQRQDQAETLQAGTIVWTAGTATHPLIQALPIPEAHRARRGHLSVTPTLQLPDFPEVFAGGDCATNTDNPLPPTAQVAYQEGAAIACNLKAIDQGHAPSPAQVQLRGSLLKLGLSESAADLFDHFEIKGKVGHLIRQATYLELLPTPVHNFKVTSEWLIDNVFHRFSSPTQLAGAKAGKSTQELSE